MNYFAAELLENEDETTYTWNRKKLHTLVDGFNIIFKNSPLKSEVPVFLNFLNTLCTGDIVPTELIDNDVSNSMKIEKLICSIKFDSNIISNELSWLPLGYYLINYCFSHKTQENMQVLFNLIITLLNSTVCFTSKVEEFISEAWNKIVDNKITLSDHVGRHIIEKHAHLLETYVIRLIDQTIDEGEDPSKEELSYLINSCRSPYMFQAVTGVLNEIFFITSSNSVFKFIRYFIKSISEYYNSTLKEDIVNLYPYFIQPLIGLLSMKPDIFREPTEMQQIIKTIQEEINGMPNKEILAVLSHFPLWITFLDISILHVEYQNVLSQNINFINQ